MKLVGFLQDSDGLVAILRDSPGPLSELVGDFGMFDLRTPHREEHTPDAAINAAFRQVFGEDMEIPKNPIVPPLEQLWLMSDVLGWPREEAAARLREATETLPVEPWDGQQGHSFKTAHDRLVRRANQ